jgi:O-acetyl-ADP-ribose deacetylase (regulator of RNase III)
MSCFPEENEIEADILYRVGDATHPKAPGVKIIAHCVNDLGAWGAGFTRALSLRFPGLEEKYRSWARRGASFRLGAAQLVVVGPLLWVANVVGQHGIKDLRKPPPIRYDALRAGLQEVCKAALDLSASVHMPRIGCGLAGGQWPVVERILVEELVRHGVPVTVYDLPKGD